MAWRRNRVLWQIPIQKQNFEQITQGVCELLWFKIILEDLKIKWDCPMRLTTTINLKSVLHIIQCNMIERNTKIDRHFIKEN